MATREFVELGPNTLKNLTKGLSESLSRSGGISRSTGPSSAAQAEVDDSAHNLSSSYSRLSKTVQAGEKKYKRQLKQLEMQRKIEAVQGKKTLRQQIAAQKRLETYNREHERTLKKIAKSNLSEAKAKEAVAKAEQKRARAIEREMRDEASARRHERMIRAREYARDAAARAQDRAASATERLAGRGLGPSGFGGETMAAGARGLAAAGGPYGIALAAVLGALAAGFTENLDNATRARLRFLNYGKKEDDKFARKQTSEAQAKAEYVEELRDIGKIKDRAKELAKQYNADADTLILSLVRAATKTGDAFASMVEGGQDVATSIAQLEFRGLGTAEELADRYIRARRVYGQTQKQAIKEMLDLSQDAREVSALTDDKFVVQMDDFYRAVEDVRGSIDSLTGSQKGLSKFMKAGVAIGQKLKLTYDQTLDSIKKLTLGLTQNYDMGFATVEVEEDINDALSERGKKILTEELGKEKADETIKALEQLRDADILPDRKAREFKELMGTSSVVMGSRLRRLAESGTQTEYAEAVLGTPMDRGMRLIYEELIKTIQEGGTGADVDTLVNKFMAESKRTVAAEEEAYKLREKVAAGEELDPQKAFAEYLQKILTTLMTGFQDLIAGINTIITKLNSIFGGGSSPAPPPPPKPGSPATVMGGAGAAPPPPTPTLPTGAGPASAPGLGLPGAGTSTGLPAAPAAPVKGTWLLPTSTKTTPNGDILLRIPGPALRSAASVFEQQYNSSEVATG